MYSLKFKNNHIYFYKIFKNNHIYLKTIIFIFLKLYFHIKKNVHIEKKR